MTVTVFSRVGRVSLRLGVGWARAAARLGRAGTMPWLDMDKVLFIHVPRAGGTSIVSHHRVGQKARAEMNPYHKFGLVYVFYRYKLLEGANFPLFTWENLIAMCQVSRLCSRDTVKWEADRQTFFSFLCLNPIFVVCGRKTR